MAAGVGGRVSASNSSVNELKLNTSITSSRAMKLSADML
jgi:hypothetical protein